MTEQDRYVGEIYESKDSRDAGRRIRILEKHPDSESWNARTSTWRDVAYRAIRVDEFGNQVGKQRTKIAARTIDVHYRKVSR